MRPLNQEPNKCDTLEGGCKPKVKTLHSKQILPYDTRKKMLYGFIIIAEKTLAFPLPLSFD